MTQETEFVIEPQRRTPIARTVDVLVAGGGPAGIAAAVAASREGAGTLLVERYGYLGGMVTGARVIWVLGVGDGTRPKAAGITRDIRARLEPLGGVEPDRMYAQSGDYVVDAETLKWQAAEMLQEAGADVLLHTMACDPMMSDGCIQGVYTESKSGRLALRAAVVVDCTADADLAWRAGCDCENETHDVTLGVVIEGVVREQVAAFQKDHPSRFRDVFARASSLNGGVMPDRTRYLKDVDVADAVALGQAEIRLRAESFRALHYLRERMPGWEHAHIRDTLPQIGVRQGRRVVGEYRVANEDLLSSRRFPDSIARLGACLDGYELYAPPGLDYDIPYRCLVPKHVDGLLVAGRCISADYLACNSLRLIVPCFATGQAAGVAAAMAAAQGKTPRDISVQELQDALARQGVYLGDVVEQVTMQIHGMATT